VSIHILVVGVSKVPLLRMPPYEGTGSL